MRYGWMGLDTELKMQPIPDYGDLMTVEEFREDCESACFIDYDGHGNLATETEMTNIVIYPSDVTRQPDVLTELAGAKHDPFHGYTHVVWFNR